MIPPPAYRDFREAYRRGDTDTVLGTAQHVLDALAADGGEAASVSPAVLLMVGAHLARRERLLDAIAYLDRGLLQLPGSSATREVGTGDWYALLLVQLEVLVGRYQQAWPLIQQLVEPDRPIETRLGATRAQLSVNAAFGDYETAYQLLNTAAGLADRLRQPPAGRHGGRRPGHRPGPARPHRSRPPASPTASWATWPGPCGGRWGPGRRLRPSPSRPRWPATPPRPATS